MILHEIVTTEKVPIRYRVAGLGARFLSWFVDFAVIVLLAFVAVPFAGILDSIRPGVGAAVIQLWFFALLWGYFLLFEWLWQGQTPGKRALAIRVIQVQGTSVTFYQSAVRNLLRAVDALPFFYGLGFSVGLCNREQRRLGDLAAGTLVVHVDRKAGPIRALHEVGLETSRLTDALIRQRLAQLDRAQKQLILDLCLRRDQLRVSDRARLFQVVADYLRQRLELVPEQYQSAEKFVLQLAGVLGER